MHLAFPSTAWSLAAISWVAAWAVLGGRIWGFWGGRWGRRTIAVTGVAVVAWLLLPMVSAGAPALRIDMLAVGDGSCFVLRSPGSTVVFDAGSSDLDAGRRRIVGALRRLGVRSVDALLISHPNLDHYSAVLEIVDEFGVGMVLVTPQLLRVADGEPAGPVMYLLEELNKRLVPVRTASAGDRREFGSCRWQWLHPPPATDFVEANDGSMVVRVQVAGRTVMLCGDIQERAMDVLGLLPGADILELPHHGSLNPRASAFVEALAPGVILQSTGRRRWERTGAPWRVVLGSADHLVTARDGACTVEIDRDGEIHVDRFIDVGSTHD